MCCCELECDDRLDELSDWLATVKRPGPSRETDSRAPDSSKLCSGIIPSDITLLPTVEPALVSKAGVDWDSSWSKLKTNENFSKYNQRKLLFEGGNALQTKYFHSCTICWKHQMCDANFCILFMPRITFIPNIVCRILFIKDEFCTNIFNSANVSEQCICTFSRASKHVLAQA